MSLSLSSTRLCISSLRQPAIRQLPRAASFLLQLPAETRTSIYCSRVAQFHASSRYNQTVTAADGTAQAAPDVAAVAPSTLEYTIYALLENLHNVSGLSWAYTIPLSAILVRGILLPWALADREAQQRYFDLQPLLTAWNIKLYNHVHYMFADTHDSDWMSRVHQRMVRYKRGELLERWDASTFSRTSLIFVQLPVFIGLSSVYRRMCGAPNGFLSGLLAALPLVGSRSSSAVTGGDQAPVSVRALVDPALAHEGMLWFPNLMLPDTTLMLGFLTSGMNLAMLVLNTTKSWRAGRQPELKLSPWRRTLLGTAGLLSLAIVPISAGMPSGVMLYWASSTAATLASNLLLDSMRPLKTAPTACKKRARVSFEEDKP